MLSSSVSQVPSRVSWVASNVPRTTLTSVPKDTSVPRVVSEIASGPKDVLVPMMVPMSVLEIAGTAEVAPDIPESTFRVSPITRSVLEGVPKVTPKIAGLPRVAPGGARVPEAASLPGIAIALDVSARAGPSSGLLVITAGTASGN